MRENIKAVNGIMKNRFTVILLLNEFAVASDSDKPKRLVKLKQHFFNSFKFV